MKELKHDLVEDTDLYKSVVTEVDKKAKLIVDEIIQKIVDECEDETMKDFIRHAPTSHRFAHEKKRIFKEEYGIDWKSHIEMNPEIIFD